MANRVQTTLHVLHDNATDSRAVDIVAVHGLDFRNKPNHAWETWTSNEKLWLRDFLPAGLSRPARITLFEYNSSPILDSAAIDLVDHAKNLLHWLNLRRKNCPERPLVFICHSLGGLVVKEALIEAYLDPSYKAIAEATRLVVFFATPHRGGNLASVGDIVGKIMGLGHHFNDLIKNLKEYSEDAARRMGQFLSMCGKYSIVSFFEGLPYGKFGIIVPKKLAILGLPGTREKTVSIDADHSSICKFDSASSPACKLALETINDELERVLGVEDAQPEVRLEVKSISKLEKQDRKCLRALYEVAGEYAHQRGEIDSPVDGTCTWVLEDAQFSRWLLDPGPSLLWITANPGCGKSVLAGFIADEWTREAHKITPGTLRFASVDFHCPPDLIRYARDQFAAKGDGFAVVPEQLWKIPCAISEDSQPEPCQIFFILDGLDECEESSRDPFLRAVVRTISSSCPNSFTGHLKILITSRPLLDIERQLQPLGNIRLRSEDDAQSLSRDLRRYIRHKVHELETTETLTAEVCKIVADKFERGADMTFLWVSLMLKRIMRLESTKRSSAEEVFEQSPSDLDELYGLALSTATERSRQLLQCILAATRQLSLSEINIALGMERDVQSLRDLDDELEPNIEKTVKRLGGFFIRFVGSDVQLVHQTARGFLLRAAPVNPSDHRHLDLLRCNVVLADRCTRFLALTDWVTRWQSIKHAAGERGDYDRGQLFLLNLEPRHRQFYQYAAKNWFIHIRAGHIPIHDAPSGAGSLDPVIQKIRNSVRMICARGQVYLHAWWSTYAYRGFYTGTKAGQLFLQHAIDRGELTILQCLLVSEGFSVTERNVDGYDVVAYAARMGKEDIVSWVLTHPVYKNMSLQWETALMILFRRHNSRLIEMLLDFDINLNGNYKFDPLWGQPMRPLATAVRHCPISILESLVSKGADILISGAIERAVKCGRLDALRWLLEIFQRRGPGDSEKTKYLGKQAQLHRAPTLGLGDRPTNQQ